MRKDRDNKYSVGGTILSGMIGAYIGYKYAEKKKKGRKLFSKGGGVKHSYEIEQEGDEFVVEFYKSNGKLDWGKGGFSSREEAEKYALENRTYAEGGEIDGISYDALLNLLKEKLEESVDDLPRHFENSYEFKGEEVEHKSRDGFIAYTDGGYEVRWFEYLSMFWGAGYSLPTSGLDNEKERQIDYSLEMAKDYFKDEYPEIVEELGEDNVDYNSLYEAGYQDEAEELSNAEQDNMDGTIMCEIGAYYYSPENDRGIDGKHTLRLFGLVNLESPYHRSGNLEDRYDIDITFDSIEDLEQKIDEGLEAIIRWFDGDFYTESTEELRIRRMAKGGMTEHGLRIGDKIRTDGKKYGYPDEIEIIDESNKSKIINLNKGTRQDVFAKGGNVKTSSISKRKPKQPKVTRFQFEEESYEYAEGGGVSEYWQPINESSIYRGVHDYSMDGIDDEQTLLQGQVWIKFKSIPKGVTNLPYEVKRAIESDFEYYGYSNTEYRKSVDLTEGSWWDYYIDFQNLTYQELEELLLKLPEQVAESLEEQGIEGYGELGFNTYGNYIDVELSSDNESEEDEEYEYAKGGFVSKGERVWNKMRGSERYDFLYKNFTPKIPPRTQETLKDKNYRFLPKDVKIAFEAEYANKEYAKGGEVDENIYFAVVIKKDDKNYNKIGYSKSSEFIEDKQGNKFDKLYFGNKKTPTKYNAEDINYSVIELDEFTSTSGRKFILLKENTEDGRVYYYILNYNDKSVYAESYDMDAIKSELKRLTNGKNFYAKAGVRFAGGGTLDYKKYVITEHQYKDDNEVKYEFDSYEDANNKYWELVSDVKRYYKDTGDVETYLINLSGYVEGKDLEYIRHFTTDDYIADLEYEDDDYSDDYAEGGEVDNWIDISNIKPSEIKFSETTAYGNPDKLILTHNGKKIGQFYYNMRGYNADFSMKNKDGVRIGFGGDKSKTKQISEFKKALKDGFTLVKFYAKGGLTFAEGGGVGEKVSVKGFRVGDIVESESATSTFPEPTYEVLDILGYHRSNATFMSRSYKTLKLKNLLNGNIFETSEARLIPSKYKRGGGIGFKGLSAKVAKRYEGKSVAPKYQSQYGTTYSKSEAKEVGDKVAGKVYWNQQGRKMAQGGLTEHGLKVGDKIERKLDAEGSVIKVKNKRENAFVELDSGYRMPIYEFSSMAKGGGVDELPSNLQKRVDNLKGKVKISKEEAIEAYNYHLDGAGASTIGYEFFNADTKRESLTYGNLAIDLGRFYSGKPLGYRRSDDDFAKGGGVYSSDDLYELLVFDVETGVFLGSERFRAKNIREAQEMGEEYEDKYKKKYRENLRFKVQLAPSMFQEKGGLMANGGGVDNEMIIAGVVHKEEPNVKYYELLRKGAKEIESSHPRGTIWVLGNKAYVSSGYSLYSFNKSDIPKIQKAYQSGNYANGGGISGIEDIIRG